MIRQIRGKPLYGIGIASLTIRAFPEDKTAGGH
jgi:hypothetical protein